MNPRNASKSEQAISHPPPSRTDGKRAYLIPIGRMGKHAYQLKPKPAFRRKDKLRTGLFSNFAESNIDDNNAALELMNMNSKVGGDSQLMETPKKQVHHHVEGGKANGGAKQKNTPESGGKRKGRGNQAKKAMNHKSEQQQTGLISPQPPPPTSSHQPSQLIPSKGMLSPVASYADPALWTEMDSESKTLEIKKMLNMDSLP